MGEIVYKGESYLVMGACFEVYREMGCGFVEAVYQECLEIELKSRGIDFRPRAALVLSYKGVPLKQRYVPDFIVFEKIVLEIKAVKEFAAEHRAQIHNYLKAAGLRLGILVNFGHFPHLDYERIVR